MVVHQPFQNLQIWSAYWTSNINCLKAIVFRSAQDKYYLRYIGYLLINSIKTINKTYYCLFKGSPVTGISVLSDGSVVENILIIKPSQSIGLTHVTVPLTTAFNCENTMSGMFSDETCMICLIGKNLKLDM